MVEITYCAKAVREGSWQIKYIKDGKEYPTLLKKREDQNGEYFLIQGERVPFPGTINKRKEKQGEKLEIYSVQTNKKTGYIHVVGMLDGERFQTAVKLHENNIMYVKGHEVIYRGDFKEYRGRRFAPNPVYIPDRKEDFRNWLYQTERELLNYG